MFSLLDFYLLPTIIIIALTPGFCILWLSMMFIFYPWSKKQFMLLDEKLFSMFQRCILLFYEHLSKTELIFYGDHEEIFKRKENVLYISNHQSSVDWIVTDFIISRQGGIGRLRYILKEELKYLPLFGAYFHGHGCIYVNRTKFEVNKAYSSLQYLKCIDSQYWMVIFPEGTRMNCNKSDVIEKSRKFARRNGLQPLDHHLTPRVKGVNLVLDVLRNFLDAIYDVTIIYEDTDSFNKEDKKIKLSSPGIFDWFKARRTVHINIKRIPITELPTKEIKVKEWLHNIFVEKDRIIDAIITRNLSPLDNEWPLKNPTRVPFSVQETFPSFLFLSGINIALLITGFGRYMYFCSVLTASIGGLIFSALYI